MSSIRKRDLSIGIIAISLAVTSILPVAAQTVNHVIFISVDGLRGDLIEDLVANDSMGEFDNFRRLQDEGAFTYNARTDFSHTNTLPNHTSMLTGLPVFQPAGQPDTIYHAYTDNGDPGPAWTLHNHGNTNLDYVPSVFDVAHDNGLSTGLFASKSKFVIYEQSYNEANGAEDTTGDDNGRDKIDAYVNLASGSPSNATNLQAEFISSFSTDPLNYNFVHYRDPDSAGHDTSWGSSVWVQSVKSVDGYLGEIFEVLDNNPVLGNDTAIILSSDHGGTGTGHGETMNPSVFTIPFFLWGPDIPAGTDIYELFPERHNPGTLQPSYNNPRQPIRNGDGGNLSLDLLGLPPIPGSFMNPHQPSPEPDFTHIPPKDAVIEYGEILDPIGSVSATLEDSFDWYTVRVQEGEDMLLTLVRGGGDLVPNLILYEGGAPAGAEAGVLGSPLLFTENLSHRAVRVPYTPEYTGLMTLAVSTISNETGQYTLSGSGFQSIPEPTSIVLICWASLGACLLLRKQRVG